MSYLWYRKQWLMIVGAVWAYVVYSSYDMIERKSVGFSQAVLWYMSKQTFIYMAVLLLVTVYITVDFKLANCHELCFQVYKRRNCGFVFGLILFNMILSFLTFGIISVLCCIKYGIDMYFVGLIFLRSLLSYCLPGTFLILAGFSIAYKTGVKGSVMLSLILLYLGSPSFDEAVAELAKTQEAMFFFQNFDFIQGRDGMVFSIDVGNMKAYKWIKMIGMTALASVVLARILLRKARIVTAGLVGVFIVCEIYYYGVHDRGLEEYMNLNSSIYYTEVERKGYLNNEYYDKTSPFRITEYDMDIKLSDHMDVKCELKLDPADTGKDQYTFTLYHTLKIKKVTYNGRKISYKRNRDFLTVGELGDGVLCIEYYGCVDNCLSNKDSIFLPENAAYYPLAGKRRLTSNSAFVNDFDSRYSVRTNVSGVYTNLDKVSDNEYASVCRGPVLIKGLINERVIDGFTVLVPKYPLYPVDDNRIRETIDICMNSKIAPDVKFIAFGMNYMYMNNGVFNGYIMDYYGGDTDAYDQ